MNKLFKNCLFSLTLSVLIAAPAMSHAQLTATPQIATINILPTGNGVRLMIKGDGFTSFNTIIADGNGNTQTIGAASATGDAVVANLASGTGVYQVSVKNSLNQTSNAVTVDISNPNVGNLIPPSPAAPTPIPAAAPIPNTTSNFSATSAQSGPPGTQFNTNIRTSQDFAPLPVTTADNFSFSNNSSSNNLSTPPLPSPTVDVNVNRDEKSGLIEIVIRIILNLTGRAA